MSTSPAVVKVLFLAGTGRCGTTILSSVLGQVDGCFAAGEIRYFWERGLQLDHRCGCGEPFSRCPVWSEVTHRLEPLPDPRRMAYAIDNRLRVRRVPTMLLRMRRGRPPVPLQPEDDHVLRLYRALSEQPGVKVILDSSKLPPYALFLSELAGVELYVVHVVRDPRATAFSWMRRKETHDRDDGATMARLETWRSAALWLIWSLLIDRWWPRGHRRNMLVRYEDFVSEPAATVAEILTMVGLGAPPRLIEGRTVVLTPTHSVAGNPNRHQTGPVELTKDIEWESSMSFLNRWAVTLVTLPGLRRFSYPISGGRSVSRLARSKRSAT